MAKKLDFYEEEESSEEESRVNKIKFDPIEEETKKRIMEVSIKKRGNKNFKTLDRHDTLDNALEKLAGVPGVKKCDCMATILCVDDNPFNLMPLTMLLKNKLGINVVEALNGA